MNSFGSTIETVQNVSTKLLDEDCNCTAIDRTTEEFCGETKTLKIIDEFQNLYETRIKNVDHEFESEFDQVCMKLEISKEWIRNLREQNVMLVQVVEDLEQAAHNRVKLLEQKLKHSSVLVSGNMTTSMHTEKTINTLANRVSDLEKDEEYMRQKIEFLQSDIRGLLELIRRAVQENHWNLEDIKFYEIQPSDIPVPNNCTCDQENINHKKLQALKLQIKHLQENERRMVTYQKELEDKLTELNAKLHTKEDTIKKYVTQFQNFSNNLRKRAKFMDQIACSTITTSDPATLDIMLVADIVESLFLERDLEIKNLQECLRHTEYNLAIATCDNDTNLNNLKIQLNEKYNTVQEVEQQMAYIQKESVKKQDILTAEITKKSEMIMSLQKQITMLQEQYRNVNMQIDFKEDIIKEMRKKLKQVVAKETCDIRSVCFNVTGSQEDIQLKNPTNQQNQIVSYLNKVKSLMEEEREDLCKLKTELEKTIEKLCCERNEECHVMNNESNVDNIKYKLARSIEHINNVYSKKEESIGMITSLLQMENGFPPAENLSLQPYIDVDQQFKLMDVFKTCAIEAQVIMDDIKDEMNVILSSFKYRHQRYIDLNKEVVNVQNQLTKSREKIAEAINRLQLREEERIRHNDRITSGKNKLKDIKNEINRAQSRLSVYITNLQTNENMSNYTEMCICNDLLCSVIEEIEQTSSSLQVFQVQGCYTTKDLEKLKNQFCEVDSSIKKLQEKIDEALSEHDIIELTLSQKEQKLKKLEGEVDMIHEKIRDVLESFFFSKEQVPECNTVDPQLYSQTLNTILQTKQDIYKLRKEHDELMYKLSQRPPYSECDKKTCIWKCRVADLQDQVKILQHEAMCNEEASNFLRNNIHSMEEELHLAQAKADSYRRSHSIDNMELKKKIIELENTLKFQKEIECTLRRQLNDSEIELKKSKELSNYSYNEHRMEESLVHCGFYQFRHDTMTVPQLLITLQNTIRFTKTGLQELKIEFEKLICEDSSTFCPSARSFTNLLEKLQKYESELDNCSQQIEELKNALYSKDKLIENMDEIIKIQKDSIIMTQAELKELHQKFQEKIDNQNQVISQYEKEKKELLRQNELQTQTIGHLQNAVVEAKKCIDQIGHRTVSDTSEKWSTSSPSVYSQSIVHDV